MSNNTKIYLPRVIDKEVSDKLSFFGAVSIDGCKWCGKSTTAEQFAASSIKLQDPANQSFIEAAKSQPSVILQGAKPRLIDEWQDFPEVWDAIRTDIDSAHLSGQYILTGSSTPRTSKPRHSGAGRIATINMHPMSLYESGESNGAVSLRELFNDNAPANNYNNVAVGTPVSVPEIAPAKNSNKNGTFIAEAPACSLEEIAYLCARGGWPESVIKKPKYPTTIAREYLEAITNREGSLDDLDYYSPSRMRTLLRSLARGVSEPAHISTILQDIASDSSASLSENTIAAYISILEKIHIVDDIEAWSPRLRSKTEIRTGKKRNLADPSLVVAALFASESDLLRDFNSFGLIFESLVMRDLRVYAEAMEGELFYYRDKNGLESDAIIHLVDGTWCAIEVKLGDAADVLDEAARKLLKLASLVDDARMAAPSFLAIVSGTAKLAYRRPDGVYILPITSLRP
ncbi:ATP-binding protein [Candidatus Saccharibacteria bacterium]|nr:ATP-binding protein [Candidatus Saccharibacteria bacterium]